jgi:hypothetical protein
MLEVPELGYKATIGEITRLAAERWPDKDFIVTPTDRLTFAQAETVSRRLAKQLLAEGWARAPGSGSSTPTASSG